MSRTPLKYQSACVYVMTCQVNKKQYVGSTTLTLYQRYNFHCKYAKTGKCKLYEAMRKYGCENLDIEVLDWCRGIQCRADLLEREQFHIDRIKPAYNSIRAFGFDQDRHDEWKKQAIQKMKQKVQCECGKKVATYYISRHRNTKRHQQYEKQFENDDASDSESEESDICDSDSDSD